MRRRIETAAIITKADGKNAFVKNIHLDYDDGPTAWFEATVVDPASELHGMRIKMAVDDFDKVMHNGVEVAG
jgi:hypothetical protein